MVNVEHPYVHAVLICGLFLARTKLEPTVVSTLTELTIVFFTIEIFALFVYSGRASVVPSFSPL